MKAMVSQQAGWGICGSQGMGARTEGVIHTVSVESITHLRGDVGEEEGFVHRCLRDLRICGGHPECDIMLAIRHT